MAIAVNTAAGLLALALLYVYAVCRLSVLQFGRHKTAWVLLHVGMGTLCGAVAAHATAGQVDLQDAASLLVATCWALLSAHEWRDGEAPRHWASRPMPLDTLPLEASGE